MKKDYREMFPQWIDTNEEYVTCLSDDIDSLVSCKLLEKYKGWEVGYFYNFKEIYKGTTKKVKAIGVDIALENGKTFDNHVTRLSKNDRYNIESANPNNISGVSRDNYTDKYAMSTALLIYSIYDIPLPTTEEGLLVLLSIDSSFLGHYNEMFKHTHNDYLIKLGYEELIEFLDNHTEDDFRRVQRKYKMNSKIYMRCGRLKTTLILDKLSEILELDLSVPEHEFKINNKFFIRNMNLNRNRSYNKNMLEKSNESSIFSLALTSKNFVSKTNIMKVGN